MKSKFSKSNAARGFGIVLLGFAAGPILSASETAKPESTNAPVSVEELAKLKQNPVSGLKQIVLQANVDPGYPDSGDTQGIYSLQVVWPFSINEDYRLVTYTIVPVYDVPGGPGESDLDGLGNTLVNLFISPKKSDKLVWGLGPTALLPTRTEPELGSDLLTLGPAALLFYQEEKWNAGLVLQNGWSLGGGSGVNNVNALGAQYLFSYNLPDGWSLYSNATITADWTQSSGDQWTVPLGGGIGKLFYAGPLPISLSLQSFYNVVTPRDGADWSVNFQLAFLFGAPQ
jgi:hypothetical protein